MLLAAAPSWAVVRHTGDDPPTGLATPSSGAVGAWSYNASCVLIAPNYVLTTRHQNTSGLVVINGVTCTVAQEWAGGGSGANADIRVARIVTATGGNPHLGGYVDVPTSSFSDVGVNVVIGGCGKTRGAAVGDPVCGYAWADNRTLQWGANHTTYSSTRSTAVYTSDCLNDDFDPPGTFAHEAAIGEWDSGGGWFRLGADGRWRVVGLMAYVERLGASYFCAGDGTADWNAAVRVKTYATWINSLLPATNNAWKGLAGVAGPWTTAGNWTTGLLPTASDDVYIDNGGIARVTAGAAATAQGIYLATGGGSAELRLEGGSVTAQQIRADAGGKLDVRSGTLQATDLAVAGTFLHSGGTAALANLALGSACDVNVGSAAALSLRGNFQNGSTDPARFAMASAVLRMNGAGASAAPQQVEVAGDDLGGSSAGWTGNFALGELSIAPGTFVRLVDAADNQLDGQSLGEALYVDRLTIEPGGGIDPAGLSLYYRNGGAVKRLFLGDLNMDGAVDGADYYALRLNFGRGDATWSDGDTNGDRLVDAADYLALWANYGSATPPAMPDGALCFPRDPSFDGFFDGFSPVMMPEPASALILLPLAVGLIRRTRR
jgi:hypothetical protein